MLRHTPAWRRLFELPTSLVDFERRGFRTDPAPARDTLEAAAKAFLDGYHAELATRPAEPPDLSFVPADRRGFAAEGAAMSATLLDALRPVGVRRAAVLHQAFAGRYAYLLHVGAGWALAKLRRRRLGRTGAEAPLLRWLGYDGMGFCQAFFSRRPVLRCPAWHSSTCDIRHQGLGRALWFHGCGDPEAVAALVRAAPARHLDDVWSGVALAATYAGGTGAYETLRDLAAGHHAALAQGAAFGAEAWRLCGHAPAHAPAAVEVLTGVSMERAAEWTWVARAGLDDSGAGPDAFREWRLRVQRSAAGRRERTA